MTSVSTVRATNRVAIAYLFSCLAIVSHGKIQNLSDPNRTGLELRLMRYGIPCCDRKVIGGLKEAVLPAPVKRQKARTARDFVGHPGLHHDFATARDDFHEVRVLDAELPRICAMDLQDGLRRASAQSFVLPGARHRMPMMLHAPGC
jgi:hypothetical protein